MEDFIQDKNDQQAIIDAMEKRLGLDTQNNENIEEEGSENLEAETVPEDTEKRELNPIEKAIEEYNSIDWEALHDNPEQLQEELNRFKDIVKDVDLYSRHNQSEKLRIALENEMLNEKMGWENEDQASTEKGQIAKYLAQQGLSQREINSVNNHKQIMIAHKAMMYDRAIALKNKSSSLPEAPSFQKPGKTFKINDAYNNKMKRLRETGSLEDAAALLKNMV